MNRIIKDLQTELKNNIDEKTLTSSERFFKKGEAAKVYGIKSVDLKRISKHFYAEVKDFSKQEKLKLCEDLWKSGYFEERVIACMWAESLHKQFEPDDFKLFQSWVHNYISNWAECDTLCNHTIGTFIMMYPEFISELTLWAKNSNRWVRRASAVTLIIPARKGLFLKNILEITDILLLDQDDLVQKGYGWLLKATSEAYTKEVFEYVIKHKAIMPRTALRYAIEKMSPKLKAEAMKK